MNAIGTLLTKSKKIVLKIGSNVLSHPDGSVNQESIRNIADQVVSLMKDGKKVVIVTSGAGIYGVNTINKWSRRGDINYKQALCAIGQVSLMNAYNQIFGEYGLHVGQILLTRDDFGDRSRTLNMRNVLFTLVDEGVVPIINENDSVGVEEIKIGDNDTLGALTANLWDADALVLLSDIDGVYDKNPKEHADAKLIEEVMDVDDLQAKIDITGKSSFGTGGIATKLEAARMVNRYGIPMVLINGEKRDIIPKLIAGEETGTVFFGK